ncbi:hypothetical protein RDWZM_000419 [Blomia tropicalis]|uniref:Peptidase M20 dimerisation domain-containing protein n=1 Tax=Blomia tropicalis TaxID=40697 RepID=A0A9Q0RPJ8_BLOTA|nr:hypothetical protein RDWZM_000419 [Blomia tropicalis]
MPSVIRTICQIASSLLICLLIICSTVVIWRTLSVQEQKPVCPIVGNEIAKPYQIEPIVGQGASIERLQKALSIRTITKAQGIYDRNEILHFHRFLRENFPQIHSSPIVTLTIVNELSLLYKINGTNESLKPYMLLAHLDVVPVNVEQWTVPPFDGAIKNGSIYGRGAVDMKSALMGIMESLETILINGITIERSFYIAIGHDEEGRGLDGALQISKYMTEQKLNDVEFILDEGLGIFQDMGGVNGNMATIGIAEKGLVYVKLSINGTTGHSSMPPKETTILKLSRAVSKLHGHSHPNRFGDGPERDFVQSLAPYVNWPYRAVYSNLWLFSYVIGLVFQSDPKLNALIRTTSAVTIINGGLKDNIIPNYAEAIINHRIYPLSSVAEVLENDRRLIDDDEINIETIGVPIEPAPISPHDTDSFGYQIIRRSIGQTFPNVGIIPGIMVASTDSRWYHNFTSNIYRFSPKYFSKKSISMIHGNDERISIDNYVRLVNFYQNVMINANQATLPIQIDACLANVYNLSYVID